jgi:hypothetical protein
MLRMVPPGLNAEYLIIYVTLTTVHPTNHYSLPTVHCPLSTSIYFSPRVFFVFLRVREVF